MLIELVQHASAGVPKRPLVISEDRTVTYAQCLARSEELARGLLARSVSRAAVVVADIGELVALLCAGSAVGVELCVYPENATAFEIEQRADELEHMAVLSDQALRLKRPLEVVPLEVLGRRSGSLSSSAAAASVLILTSGTTSSPKAARHDWRRLVSAAAARPGTDDDARWLLAYNLSQFGGLQVLIHVLVGQATLVVPRTRHVDDALDAMRRHNVTHVSATPTFWRMLVGRLDVASAASLQLRQITLGGEIVPGPLLTRLQQLFPSAHISQVYAATEFGSAVSVSDGRPGLPVSVLERRADADVQLRIVEGELHARSRVGMLGYHSEPASEGGWRPTGDLVELRGDRIYFVGRTTDIINVGGVKVQPATVEELVSGVEGVSLARVYGRPNPVTGEIVALDVVPARDADTADLERAIRSACRALAPAAQPRLVKFVSALPVSGDKIDRRVPTPS